MTLPRIALVVPVSLIAAGSSSLLADSSAVSVNVRVYDTVTLSSHVKTQSFRVASTALAPVGHVLWKECTLVSHTAPSCEAAPDGEFILRIVQSPARQSRQSRELPLGDTFVDTATRQAVLATIYVDRVERVAAAARIDPGTLLGYAVAHEIGHLLLASTAHSATGLMRPIWREDELQRGHRGDWRLAADDAAAMMRRLVQEWRLPSSLGTD